VLLVKTYLDKSKIDGLGLFAGEFIPRGKVIWKFIEGFDILLKKKEFDRLGKLSKVTNEWLSTYTFYDKDFEAYVVCMDDARFFNHSKQPNTDNSGVAVTIAKKDIARGEELTCDYFEFDEDAALKLGRESN